MLMQGWGWEVGGCCKQLQSRRARVTTSTLPASCTPQLHLLHGACAAEVLPEAGIVDHALRGLHGASNTGSVGCSMLRTVAICDLR